MAGYDIYIYGTNTENGYPADLNSWLKVPILGLDYENSPADETKRTQLGGYINPKTTEKRITINTKPIDFSAWFSFVDTLTDHLLKKYVYVNRGTYPASAGTSLPTIFRVVPIGTTIEHSYKNGTKSIDVKCVVVS